MEGDVLRSILCRADERSATPYTAICRTLVLKQTHINVKYHTYSYLLLLYTIQTLWSTQPSNLLLQMNSQNHWWLNT